MCLKIEFPKKYPFEAPHVKFDPVLYHPMVVQKGSNMGEMCFPLLAPGEYKSSTSVGESKLGSSTTG